MYYSENLVLFIYRCCSGDLGDHIEKLKISLEKKKGKCAKNETNKNSKKF